MLPLKFLKGEKKSFLGFNPQFSSVAQLCPTYCDPMDCSTPGFPDHHQLLSIKLVMPSNHLILCHSLLLPSIFSSSSLYQVANVLECQHQSFQYIFRTDFL